MFGHKTRVKAAVLFTPLLMAAAVASNGDQYVCSVGKAVECDKNLNCGPPAPEENRPTFIHVDLEDGQITLLAPPERRGETTQIRAIEREDDRLIMSGIDAGRGWSMNMSEVNGDMSVTVNFGDAALVVFGQCIREDQVTP
jgi:hypothetical protein